MLRRRRQEAGGKRPRRRIRKLRVAVLLCILGLLALAAFTFGLITAVAAEIPELDPSRRPPTVNGYIYASDGHKILAVLRGSESRTLVQTKDIPFVMRHAIVDVEDRRFYEHRGIDLRGIARAIWSDARNQAVVEGGSTITQQFVKNRYVKRERTITRKLMEAALAWQLEQRWKDKNRILTAYLNTIYFGNGAYGIQQAAVTYFGHGAAKLTLPEAALLAGIPADPAGYDPVTNPRAARERRRLVLEAMLAQGDITRSDLLAAERSPLPRPQDVHLPGTEGPAQYFVNYVKQQLVQKYGSAQVFGGGLRVRTTIDLDLQRLAREAIAKWLTVPEGPSAALVAIDPRSGRVLAMVGGKNYRESQFNLAVQGERQPGSAFKPFVLAAALEQGIAPSTTFVSEPTLISLGDRVWSVHNYEDAYLGPVTLETATVQSDNAVYAQLTRLVGPANVARTAAALGIRRKLNPYFAIGLGADPVSPLELARAYSAFADGGLRIDGAALGNRPRVVLDVRNERGRLVRDGSNAPVLRRVLRPETVTILNGILQEVVRSGTGRRAALADRPAAGKTGTTENYGDAWFVGYTPQLVTAVWVGYPTRLTPMLTEYGGEPVAGGTFPALIWKSFVESALSARESEPLPFPTAPTPYASTKRVVWRDGQARLDNGNCREGMDVAYFSGFGPATTADCKPNEVEVPSVVGETLAAAERRLAEQPLEAAVVYRPAEPLQRTDVVLAQYPRRGRLSSYDKVTLVLAKPLDGRVPRLVGLSLSEARAKLRAAGLRVGRIRFGDGPAGTVLSQQAPPGVAAAAGMSLDLVVARG